MFVSTMDFVAQALGLPPQFIAAIRVAATLSLCGQHVRYIRRIATMTSWKDEPGEGAAIHVEPALRRAVITWAPGVPVFNPWMATIDTLLSHPDFKPEFAVISDWRGAKGTPQISFVEAFLVFCQSVRRARRLSGRWAIVVSPDADTGFGAGRMMGAHPTEQGLDHRLFKSLDEALAWATAANP
jgi:hypothetical protein